MAKKRKKRVRAKAIGVFCHEDRLLVSEGYDFARKQFFYTQLGGGIEFMETAAETIKREVQEEIGAAVTELQPLGTLENIFTFEDHPGHEILMVYAGHFVDQDLYRQKVIHGAKKDAVYGRFKCMWLPLDVFRRGELPLYPNGIIKLLQEHNS